MRTIELKNLELLLDLLYEIGGGNDDNDLNDLPYEFVDEKLYSDLKILILAFIKEKNISEIEFYAIVEKYDSGFSYAFDYENLES